MEVIHVGILVLFLCPSANMFPAQSFDPSTRNSNCTNCLPDLLQVNIREVFPRLTRIKQQIQRALNRTMDLDRAGLTREGPSTPQPANPRLGTYTKHEIVSHSETLGVFDGDVILKFRIHSNTRQSAEEAVGVSLLLFVDRRQKVRKGGKGKKIFLDVSKYKPENSSWETLTCLRTRVKKRRWKRISLPVSVAQQLLDSDDKSLDLKVKCVGCGRLVQLVLSKDAEVNNTARKNNNQKETSVKLKNRTKRVKRRKHHANSRRKKSRNNSPMLIISTQYLV